MSSRSPGIAVAWAVAVIVTVLSPARAFAASDGVEMSAVISFFVAVIAVAALIMVGHQRSNAQRHQTLRAMVEKGVTIPPRLLEGAPRDPRRDLRWGILLVSAGIGIGLFLLFDEGAEEAALGLIPMLIGAGYLVLAKLEWSRPSEAVLP